MKKWLDYSLIIFFILIYFILKLLLNIHLIEENTGIELLRITVLLLYFLCVYISYKKLGTNYVVVLFLGTLFLFQYGRINFLWITEKLPEQMTWFSNYKYNLQDKIFVTDLLFCNTVGNFLGVLGIKKCEKIELKDGNIIDKEKIIKLLIIGLILTGGFFCYQQYVLLQELKKHGYLGIYLIGVQNVANFNILIRAMSSIFQILPLIGLALFPGRKKYIWLFLSLFNFINLILSLKGNRGPFMIGILFSLWYILMIFKKKLDMKKSIIILVSLVMVSFYMSEKRSNIQNKNNDGIIKKIEKFIFEQGVTGTFLVTPRTNPKIYKKDKIPYIFSSLTYEHQNQKEYIIENNNNVEISNAMSYYLSKHDYRAGFGTGGNYILEMYDLFGKMGVLILSYIFIRLIYIYSILAVNSKFLFFRTILIGGLGAIFWAPRGAYMFFSISVGRLVLIVVLILLIEVFLIVDKKYNLIEKIEKIKLA